MDINSEMREQWNSIARINAHYGIDSIEDFEKSDIDEELFYKRGAETAKKFLDELGYNDPSDLTMVEIGCGLGRMSHHFADCFGKVYSFDVSDEMIKRSSEKFKSRKNLEFILGSGSDLRPLKKGSVDFVFSFIVLQHVLRSEIIIKYIYETGRVLKKDGKAFLQFRTFTPDKTANRLHITRIIPSQIRRFIKNMVFKKAPAHNEPRDFQNLDSRYNTEFKVWHGCAISIYEVERAIRRARLNIVNISGINTQYTFYLLSKK